jgi:hypothetical protein
MHIADQHILVLTLKSAITWVQDDPGFREESRSRLDVKKAVGTEVLTISSVPYCISTALR